MTTKSEIDYLLFSVIKEVIKDNESIDKDSTFIGADSNIDSIDIVQIISSIEDKLEDIGHEGFDLFEITFQEDCLTFSQFSDLILKNLKNRDVCN